MDFSEQVKNLIQVILATGVSATTIFSAVNLFKGIFSGVKLNKLTSFVAVADANIKENQISFKDLKKQLISEIKTAVVDPLVAEVKALSNDNVALANLSVSLLSLVNVPLDQKRQFFNALSKINSISSESLKLLEANIASEEAKKESISVDNAIIESKINNS